MEKTYYYYTRWFLPEDPHGDLTPNKDGVYGPFHTTWMTDEDPKTFLAQTILCSELFVKEFKTEEEMDSYWETCQPKRTMKTVILSRQGTKS